MITTQAGKYTPNITLVNNVINVSISECFWTKFNTCVRVSGEITISTESINSLSKVLISLPHVSEIINSWEISGTGVTDYENSIIVAIIAEDNKACLIFKPNFIFNDIKIPFSFSYNV